MKSIKITAQRITKNFHNPSEEDCILQQVEGYIIPELPNMAITPHLDDNDFWGITHISSGRGVGVYYESIEDAKLEAIKYLSGINWDKGWRQLLKDKKAYSAIEAMKVGAIEMP